MIIRDEMTIVIPTGEFHELLQKYVAPEVGPVLIIRTEVGGNGRCTVTAKRRGTQDL